MWMTALLGCSSKAYCYQLYVEGWHIGHENITANTYTAHHICTRRHMHTYTHAKPSHKKIKCNAVETVICI